MKTNLEKWNYYLSIINDKTKKFIDSQLIGKEIPDKYYVVYPVGKIAERKIFNVKYSHYVHNGKTYFSGKKPTKKDVLEIAEYSNIEIPFSVDNIWFEYSEYWNNENFSTSSSVNFNDLINKRNLFFSIDEAEIQLNKIKKEEEFMEQHKKDLFYDYKENGYKFLGWQNAWKHESYDEDGNLCSETNKSSSSFGYSKENYPEYRNCIDSKHRRIEVSHNRRGSENTVSSQYVKYIGNMIQVIKK